MDWLLAPPTCSRQSKLHWENKLSIKKGETTADGLFTLKVVECLGACGYAPMMQFGKTYREYLTKEKVDTIIDECIAMAAANN